MYIDIFALILLITSVVGLSLAILFLVRFYTHMIKKIEETEKEKLLLHNNITQKAQEILSQAHENNVSIITKANQDAAQILSDATKNKISSNELLMGKLTEVTSLQEQTLKKLSDEFLASYQKTLEGMKNQDLTEIKKVTSEFEKEVDAKLTDFSKTLQKETIEAESGLKTKTEKQYALAEAQIEQYKAQQFEKIRSELFPMLQKLSTLILGKALTLEDHEKLIQEALQDAQKELLHNSSNYNNTDQKTSIISAN